MKSAFHAAARTIDVTPNVPVILAANGQSHKAIAEIDDPIEWQILRLHNGMGEIWIISGDFFSAGVWLRQIVENALPNIPPENILLAATHTHNGPAIDDMLPHFGIPSPHYLAFMVARLKDALEQLSAAEMSPANIKYGSAEYPGNVYRRRRVVRLGWPLLQVTIMPDESVSVPSEISLIRIEGADGQPIALIWSWPCHPNLYPKRNVISADFPGHIRKDLRKHNGDIPVLFLQGFAGDINPMIYDCSDLPKGKLKKAIYGKTFGQVDPAQWRSWADGLADAVKVANCNACANQPLKPAKHSNLRANAPLSRLQDEEVDGRDLMMQKLYVTQDLAIAALGAEPVHGLARHIAAQDGSETVVAIGYIDHVFGYLPTDRQLSEKGYEGVTFRSNFTLPGNYYPDIEERLAACLSEARIS